MKSLDTKMLSDLLSEINTEIRKDPNEGIVASYIPELAKMSADYFAVSCCMPDGTVYHAGDTNIKFTMQSISKTLLLAFAIELFGDAEVFKTVDCEVCSEPFNSIVKLETSVDKRPLNPFINAGAIAISSLIVNKYGFKDGVKKFQEFIGTLNEIEPGVNEAVFHSERDTASRNRALAYFMESTGILKADINDTLDLYFTACSLDTDTDMLAEIASVLALGGQYKGKRVISRDTSKILYGLMSTCGLYDASGSFAVTTGLPAKSGVSGGIMALASGRMGLATFAPPLDKNGNSVKGVKALSEISDKLCLRGF